MSIFSKIWNKLNDPWGIHEKRRLEKEGAAAPTQKPTQTAARSAAPQPVPSPISASAPPAAAAPQAPVDVEAVLSEIADKKGGGGNWRTSIVDLLKLLELDSSLAARKELADELGVRAGEHGSAEQNIALQKALLRKLAANGGKVPKELLD